MSHYSDKPGMVRVDFFKESGKWYTTEAVDMTGAYDAPDMWEVLTERLPRREDGTFRYSGMWAVCLSPYHANSHPMMFRVPEVKP